MQQKNMKLRVASTIVGDEMIENRKNLSFFRNRLISYIYRYKVSKVMNCIFI